MNLVTNPPLYREGCSTDKGTYENHIVYVPLPVRATGLDHRCNIIKRYSTHQNSDWTAMGDASTVSSAVRWSSNHYNRGVSYLYNETERVHLRVLPGYTEYDKKYAQN